jgi:hypothetical protein
MVIGVLAPCTHAGVIADWDLDEVPGTTTAFDSSGSGNDGTLFNGTGSARFMTHPMHGGGVELHGGGDYIDFGDAPEFNPGAGNPFSMEAWFILDNTGNKPIIGRTQGPASPIFALEASNAGSGLRGLQFYPGEDLCCALNNPSNARDLSTLTHLVGTFDGVGTAILYKNGSAEPFNGTKTFTPNYNTTANPLRAGADNVGGGAYDGIIFHLRIYDEVLTVPQVLALFDQGPNPFVGEVIASTNVVVDDTLGVSFQSELDRTYQLESTPDLVSSNFTETGAFAIGDGGGMTLFDPSGPSTSRNYRVQQAQ